MRLQYLFLCVLPFFGSSFGYAQQPQDSLTTLKEILVVKETAKDIIAPQILEGEQLRRLNSVDIADALRYFAGVKIKDYGGMGGLKTVDVRNMGTHQVGVFYNGVQLGNAQNGVVDLGKFSLDDVEAIQLYNGQRSAPIQAAKEYAAASAIYIQSKRPTFTAQEKIKAQFHYKLGSIQWTNPSARVAIKVNDHVSTSISTAYLYANGKYKFRQKRFNLDGTVAYDTTAYRKNSGIESFRIENNWFGQDEGNTWQVNLYYYQSHRGLPEAIIKKSDATLATEQNNEKQNDKNVMVQGEWKRVVSPLYQWMVKGKFAYDQLHYESRKTVGFQGEEVTYNPQFDNTYHQQEWYLSASHLFTLAPFWSVSLATDVQYNKLNATRLGQEALFTYPERYTFYTVLSTSVGVGRFKAQANLLGTFTAEKVRYNYQAPNRSLFTPSVFLRYQPWELSNFTVHAFYKQLYRLPTFNDLYYTQMGTSHLKPEHSRQFNVGFTHQLVIKSKVLKEVQLTVEAYCAQIKDKIIASPTSSMMRWMMSNLGKVENYGVESQIKTSWEPFSGMKAQVGLTYDYTIAQDLSVTPSGKPSYYGDQIPYTPWHSGSGTIGVDYRNWQLNYSFIYVGKRYNGNKNNTVRNELQPWYTHDLNVQRELQWNNKTIQIRAEANNLANQYYEVVTNFPMPGRNFRLSLQVNL
ncbi:TonB-dependent receptor [Myroides fluvii]|uniref:TonB-dependent receptor n=1 Tax=Myroides fluvii TaxID=2572594 RepID=UPI00131D8692|nr:TonB-dependent receptor plug domain-containing protein [Myroides fluvii]